MANTPQDAAAVPAGDHDTASEATRWTRDASELDALPARTRIVIEGDDVLTKGNDGQWRGGPYGIDGHVWVGAPDDPEAYLPVLVIFSPGVTR